MQMHKPAHPGEVLKEVYLEPLQLTVTDAANALGVTRKALSELVNERITAYPVSGEINHSVEDPGKLIEAIEQRYSPGAESVDHTDGLSICFEKWRFNLRMSNTEPVVRLNVESRGDGALMRAKTDELIAIIES